MAIRAQAGCTLSTIVDVEAVYTYYYLASSTITTDEAPKDNVNQPGASTITITSGGQNYVWQLTEPTLSIVDDIIQTAVGQLYVIECTLFSNGTYDWGPLMTSSTYAAAKAAYNLSSQALSQAQQANDATALLGGHFMYGGSIGSSTPAGARIIEQIKENNTDVSNNPSKWLHNVIIGSNGIELRYNEAIMAQLAANQSGNNTALKFYKPPTISGSTTTQGGLAMQLDTNGLSFYGSSQSTPDATLSALGLKTIKGGIEAGTPKTNNFVYLSSEDYTKDTTNGITINGHTPDTNDPAWRQIIGTKFGVDAEGNLYASSGSIGSSVTIGGLDQSAYLNSNIQVGGRNLAKATGTPSILTAATEQYWFSPAFAYTSDYGKALLANTDNTTFTVSYDYVATGLGGSITLRTLLQKANGIYGIGTIIKGQLPVLPTGNSSGHVEITFELEEGHREFGGMWMLMSNNNASEKSAMASATITITNFKFEIGTNATDWTPAPEDVQAEIDAKKSVHTLMSGNTSGASYSTILNNYASEGSSNQFVVSSSTPTTGIKVGDTVRLGYYVSNMGTEGNRPIVYIVGTTTAIADTTHITLTGHGLDTTVIDGGHILTGTIDADRIGANSITASKLRIGDYNNYITATENDEESLVSGVIFEETSTIDEDTLVTLWIYKNISSSSNLWVSPIVNNWTKEGEQYRITGKLKIPENGRVGIAIQGRDSNGDFVTNNTYSISGISANEEVDINGIITISAAVAECAKCNIGIYFYKGSSGSTYQVGYCRQMKLERISSFITAIDEDGIKIHASDSTNTNYIQLDNENLQIYSNGNSVAQYGDSSRIGLEFGAHFVIESDKLQAYNSSNELYFQVTSQGISFGNNMVAIKEEVDNQIATVQENITDAGKTATSFITNLGNDGIKIHSANDSTDSILINSKHIIMYRNNIDVMQLTDSALRIGAENSGHVSLQSNELGFYDGASKVAYVGSDKLFIENSEITDTLRVGQFLWKVHANNANRISLVYEPITT